MYVSVFVCGYHLAVWTNGEGPSDGRRTAHGQGLGRWQCRGGASARERTSTPPRGGVSTPGTPPP